MQSLESTRAIPKGCWAPTWRQHRPEAAVLSMHHKCHFWSQWWFTSGLLGRKKKRSNLSSESAPPILLHLLQDFVSNLSPHSSERSFYWEDSGLTVKLKPGAYVWGQTKCSSGTGSFLSFQISQNQLFVWDFLHKPSSWGKHSTPKYQGCELKKVPEIWTGHCCQDTS